MSAGKLAVRVAGAVVSMIVGMAAVADEQHLEVTTIVHKEVVVENEHGQQETQLITAESVVPGERVVYTISFRNVGEEAAGNVTITNPIAETLSYVAGSAAGNDLEVQFSVDGGQSFAPAGELRIVDNGIERPAATVDYTHVRWVMQSELAAGSEGQATFAAVLE